METGDEKIDSRRSMRKTVIVVAASLAFGTAMMATATIAFARGGGGGGGRFGSAHFGGFGAGHFGGGFGSEGFYYGDGYNRCYVPTPYGYSWARY
jgi:hypothetical protein